MENFQDIGPDPDPVCPERLDPVNIRPDLKPWWWGLWGGVKKYHFLFLLPFDAEAFKTWPNWGRGGGAVLYFTFKSAHLFFHSKQQKIPTKKW